MLTCGYILGKPQEAKKDTFAEKMAMQVIKNLQVKVKNIHVRFEDTFTNPDRPFGFGVTLSELAFETTDENWKPCILGESVKLIHKVGSPLAVTGWHDLILSFHLF